MPSCNYKLFIFDMDGTLLDTSTGIIKSIRYTIEIFHKAMPGDDVLKKFIGPPLRESFSAMPDVLADEVDDMVTTFRKRYSEEELFNAQIYDGIFCLCQKLKDNDIKIAVATNKPEKFAKKLVKYFHLDQYINVVCGADELGTLTKADLIYKVIALEKLSNKKQAVMVGDTLGDAEAAYRCGIDFIGVRYGFGLSAEKGKICQYEAVRMADTPLGILEGML